MSGAIFYNSSGLDFLTDSQTDHQTSDSVFGADQQFCVDSPAVGAEDTNSSDGCHSQQRIPGREDSNL